jgi:hypothetical protein
LTQDGASVYLIDTGKRYPSWVQLTPPGGAMIDCHLFFDLNAKLKVVVSSGTSVFVADPATIDTDGWNEDLGVRGVFSASPKSLAVEASIGSSVNHSLFGYVVASAKSGLGLVTGGSYNIQQPSISVRRLLFFQIVSIFLTRIGTS